MIQTELTRKLKTLYLNFPLILVTKIEEMVNKRILLKSGICKDGQFFVHFNFDIYSQTIQLTHLALVITQQGQSIFEVIFDFIETSYLFKRFLLNKNFSTNIDEKKLLAKNWRMKMSKLNYVLISMDLKSTFDVIFEFLNYIKCHLMMLNFRWFSQC